MNSKTEIDKIPQNTYKNRLVSLILMVVGIGGLLISVVASINFGAADLSYRDVYNALFQFDEDNPAHTIIRQLRFPRAIAAVCVGAALAVSGAIMQGMTRNPLASPSIMGVTAGSSFLIAIALVVIPGVTYLGLMMFSFVGAGLGAALVSGSLRFREVALHL